MFFKHRNIFSGAMALFLLMTACSDGSSENDSRDIPANTSDAQTETSLDNTDEEVVEILDAETIKDIAYGTDPAQKLDLYLPVREVNAKLPVAFMVHGGAWRTGDKASAKVTGYKKDYFLEKGFAFVSVNYRLAPDHMYPKAVNDLVRSVAWLDSNQTTHELDPSKIILIGHSAGAHLASVLATNAKFLKNGDFDQSRIKGLIMLDTYFYDIEESYALGGTRETFIKDFFGTDTEKMRDGSPTNFVDSLTPPTLIFNRSTNIDSESESRSDFIDKIEAFDTTVMEKIIPEYSHDQFNELFGKSGDQMTTMSDSFLESLSL